MKTKQKNSTTKSYLAERISSRGGILALVFGITCMIFNDFKVNPDSNPADFNTIAVDYNSIGIIPNSIGNVPNSNGINPNSNGINPNPIGINPNSNGINPNSIGIVPNPIGIVPNPVGTAPNPGWIAQKSFWKTIKLAPKPRNPVMALHNLIRGSPRPTPINQKPARDSAI